MSENVAAPIVDTNQCRIIGVGDPRNKTDNMQHRVGLGNRNESNTCRRCHRRASRVHCERESMRHRWMFWGPQEHYHKGIEPESGINKGATGCDNSAETLIPVGSTTKKEALGKLVSFRRVTKICNFGPKAVG